MREAASRRLHQETAEDLGVCNLPFSWGPPGPCVTPAAGVSLSSPATVAPGYASSSDRRQGWGWGIGTGCRLAVRALPSGVQDHVPRVERLCYEDLSRWHCLLGRQLDAEVLKQSQWGHSSWKEWKLDVPSPFHCRGEK